MANVSKRIDFNTKAKVTKPGNCYQNFKDESYGNFSEKDASVASLNAKNKREEELTTVYASKPIKEVYSKKA